MKLNESIMKNLKEDAIEVPKYESFRNQILNDLEMYYEDLMNDDDDVFGGTQDSYANEMVEQHLFDTLYYNIKHNYESKDAAMNTANDLVYYILDFVDHGEKIGLQNDKVIKEIYDKYVLDKTDDSINESVDQKSLKKELFVRLNGPKASLNQAIKELKNDNELYLKAESNIRFNYENLIEDLTNTLHSIIEFQNSLLFSESESKGDSNEDNN